MSFMGFQPDLVSTGTIWPFRFVQLNTTAPFSGMVTAANSLGVIGVTDGSTRAWNSTSHADAGDRINLQPTNVVQIMASAAISVGAKLGTTSDGKAVTATASSGYYQYIALESATADGDVIRAFRIGGPILA